jgi:hypothetical protein
MHHDDALREVDKVLAALQRAGDHLSKQNEANAALHLADKVLYSPLTVAVLNAADSAAKLRDHLAEQAAR